MGVKIGEILLILGVILPQLSLAIGRDIIHTILVQSKNSTSRKENIHHLFSIPFL